MKELIEEMKLRNSWILVERMKNEKTFAGSMILMPETTNYDSPFAKVLLTGPGRQKTEDLTEYIDVRMGDTVILDNIFTSDRNKLEDNLYIVDVKEIEATVTWEDSE